MNAHTTLLEDLSKVTRKMRTVFDNRAKARGLSLARARILLHLRTAKPGETQKAIAEALEIEGPTLVRLLDGLEKAETIRRVVSDEDRRAKGIELTPDGGRQADDVDDMVHVFRSEALDGISAEELESACRVLAHIQTNLERMS